MQYLVISSSLSPTSRSRVLAREAVEQLAARGESVALFDVAEHPLPPCDADTCYADPNVKLLAQQVREADGILLAAPVYNYDVSATAKGVIELTGRAWTGKIAGFLCAAGGRSSYMGVLNLMNSLMLDFRTIVIPRFVYSTKADFENGRLTNADVATRVEELVAELVRFSEALAGGEG